MIYNNAIQSIRAKKCDFEENTFIMLQCRTPNSNLIFEKIGTDELQIDAEVELSEKINIK